jgi:hypothetical protein
VRPGFPAAAKFCGSRRPKLRRPCHSLADHFPRQGEVWRRELPRGARLDRSTMPAIPVTPTNGPHLNFNIGIETSPVSLEQDFLSQPTP